MAIRHRLLSAALATVWMAGCGSGGPAPVSSVGAWLPSDAGTPVEVVPASVSATRFPNVCGVANPPWLATDTFSLDVLVGGDGGASSSLELTFDPPRPAAGVPVALSVMAFDPQGISVSYPLGQTTWYPFQYASGNGINFTYIQGSNAADIDTGAYDSAIVSIVQMPAKEGDPLTARIQLHFVDGKLLDQTFSSPVVSDVSNGCPHG